MPSPLTPPATPPASTPSLSTLLLRNRTLTTSLQEKSQELVDTQLENDTLREYVRDLENQVKRLKEVCGVAPEEGESTDSTQKESATPGTKPPTLSSVSNASFQHTQSLISHKEHIAEKHQLSHQIQTLQLERDRLQDELIVRKLVEQENVKLKTQLNQMKQQMEFLTRFIQKSCSEGEQAALAEVQIYKNELMDAQREYEKRNLQEAYVKLDHEARDALQSQEHITQALHEENLNLQNVLQELNTLQTQNENLRRQSELSTTRLTKKKRELQDLQRQLDLERERNDEYADILHATRMEQVSTDILKSEIQSRTSGMKSLQHQLAMAQREIRRLKSQLGKKGVGKGGRIPQQTLSSELITRRSKSVQRHNSMDVLSIWNSSYDEYSEQHRRRQQMHQQQEYNDNDSNADQYYDEESEEYYEDQQQYVEGSEEGYSESGDMRGEDGGSPSTAVLVYDVGNGQSPRTQQQIAAMKRKQNPHPLSRKPLSKIQREADEKLSVLSKTRHNRGRLAPMVIGTGTSDDNATAFASAGAGLARRGGKQQGMQLNASSIQLQQPSGNSRGSSNSTSTVRNVFSAEFGTRFVVP